MERTQTGTKPNGPRWGKRMVAMAVGVLVAMSMCFGVASAMPGGGSVDSSSTDTASTTSDGTGAAGASTSGNASIVTLSNTDGSGDSGDADDGNAFMLSVANADGTYIIEPSEVSYTDGQTVQQALESTSYEFVFDDTGFLSSVKGVKPAASSYTYYYTDYDSWTDNLLKSIPASEVTSVFITCNPNVGSLSADHCGILDQIHRYESQTGGLHNYPDAVSAYNACITGLPTADASAANTLYTNLKSAIDAYDSIMNGTKYPVEFAVTKGGATVTNASIVMMDEYGNQTVAQNGVANVVAGTYSYKVLDSNGHDGVYCKSIAINQNALDSKTKTCKVSAEIPNDEWLESISLRVKSDGNSDCRIASGSVASRSVSYYVPDSVKANTDLYVYAVAGNSISSISGYNSKYLLYANYTGVNGKAYSQKVGWNSSSFAPQNMVDPGVDNNNVVFEVRYFVDSTNQTYQFEDCNAFLQRSPTLGSLSVKDGSVELLNGFSGYTKSYSVVTSADSLTFSALGLASGAKYSYTVNGVPMDPSSGTTVQIPSSAYTTPYPVNVVVALDNGTSSPTSTYTVNVSRGDQQKVTFTHDSDVTVQVFNQAGSEVTPVQDGTGDGSGSGTGDGSGSGSTSPSASTSTSFELLDGVSYTYVGTKDKYYHVKKDFTASNGLVIPVSTPSTNDYLSKLQSGYDNLYTAKSEYKDTSNNVHEHSYMVPDTQSRAWFKATAASSNSDLSYAITYTPQNTGSGQTTSTFTKFNSKGTTGATGTAQFIIVRGGYGNTAKLTVTANSQNANGETEYQDYNITMRRSLSLTSMLASYGGNEGVLVTADSYDTNSQKKGFDPSVTEYVVGVPQGTSSIDFSAQFVPPTNGTNKYTSPLKGGYTLYVDDAALAYDPEDYVKQTVQLDTTKPSQQVKFHLVHEDTAAQDTTYTVEVRQLPAVKAMFNLNPSDANVNLIDQMSNTRIMPNEDGTYTLIDTFEYSWTASAKGYVGTSGSFTAKDGISVDVNLQKAAVNPSINPSIASEWPYFRADEYNNSVVSSKSPTSADDAVLYWANQLGSGYDKNAVGCPILADGYMYTYAGDQIYKVDTVTGKVVAQGTMVGTSSFAITPMTYAEGMVFCALSNGKVQAFNADTLESLWVYTSPNSGQPNCPIAYHDGLIYTGFWNYSTKCDFVCLTTTDEDPTRTNEAKQALWANPNYGGYYWAGAYAGDNFVLEGSDNSNIGSVLGPENGTKFSGTLYSFDPKTGAVLDTITSYPGDVGIGDIRSTVVFDPSTSTAYWVGRAGYFCHVKVNSNGTFDKSTLTILKLVNGSDSVTSTATPVIYNGRAYIDADTGSYGAYKGQCVDVVDIATNSIAYTVNVGGRAQSSPLLTTGYVDSEGYVYLYFIDNYPPGKVRYFKDKPGQTKAITSTTEVDSDGTSYDVADVLFAPAREQAQYCICSPIIDQYGTIYFKNDSAYMMAVGPTIKSIDVTTAPTRLNYGVGEKFDTTGMTVTATLSNGLTRDITDYCTFTPEKVNSDGGFASTGQQEVAVEFPYTMYQNNVTDGEIGTAPDYNYTCPSTSVTVNVVNELNAQITTTELPAAKATTPFGTTTQYEFTFKAVGEPEQYQWSLTGNLPDGIAFNAATGTLNGTPAKGTGGDYPITVTVSNGIGTPDSKSFVLRVNQQPVVEGPNGSSTLDNAVVGQQYSVQMSATGYPEEYTWSVNASGDQLPEGLTLDPATGVISGKPAAGTAGTYNIRINAANEAGTSPAKIFTLKVDEAPAIATTMLADGEVGSQYSQQVAVTGSPVPTVSVGGLPEGLSYDAASGTISGTPKASGTYTVTIAASNGVGEDATQSIPLIVYEAPQVVTGSLSTAVAGKPYSQAIEATGYPEPTVEVTGLPDGLAYNAQTGCIEGTPTQSGSYQVTVTAGNGVGTAASKTLALTVDMEGVAPAITTTELPAGTARSEYSAKVEATGTPTPTFGIAGLPDGLSCDSQTGQIHGTPSQAGTYSVEVTASNGVEPAAVSTFQLVIGQYTEAPGIATTALANAVEGQQYSQALEVSGAPAPTISVSGLPEGLAYNAQTGCIEGIPSQSGTYSVTIAASNGVGADATTTLDLVVAPASAAPAIATSALAAGSVGQAYSQPIEASGKPAPTVTVSGLPDGLAYNSQTGCIEGTPTTGGSYSVEITASNGVAPDATATLTLVVNQAPAVVTSSLAQATLGSSYSQAIETTGYPAPTVSVTGLPQGLQYDQASGYITGTPEEAGAFSVAITAANDSGTSTVYMSLNVAKSGTTWTRLYGQIRYDTMAAIVYKAYPDKSCDRILLTSGAYFADALTASALSGLWDAPIITTDPNSLSPQAAQEISRVASGHATVYVLGGTAAVSQDVENAARQCTGVSSTGRIWGQTRLETGLDIYNHGIINGQSLWGNTAIVGDAFNYPDGLSAGPWAAAAHAPIFGTSNGHLSADAVAAIKSGGFKYIVVLGGDSVVDFASVKADLGDGFQYTRLAGQTRYETSAKIVSWTTGHTPNGGEVTFQPTYQSKLDGMGVAAGSNFPDALTSVDLLGRQGSALLLVTESDEVYSHIQDVIAANSATISHGYVIGGPSVVTDTVKGWCEAVTQ